LKYSISFSGIEDIKDDLKDDLLFIHAWSGCDTTSSIFGKGKGNLVATIRKTEKLKENSAIIHNVWSSQNEVGDASIAAFKIWYAQVYIITAIAYLTACSFCIS